MSLCKVAKVAPFFAFLFAWTASAEPLELYIDADYSVSAAAAGSIELGVRAALDEVGYVIGGEAVSVVPIDHRGNVKRSRRTMERFLESDRALAMIGGMHSPPYITHRDFINESGVLTLLPWSAAGPITRAAPGVRNWIFRLSVDDNKSGAFLAGEAIEKGGCDHVALVLLDTGWGRANFRTLVAAFEARGAQPSSTHFFEYTIGKAAAASLAADIVRGGADCAILLANWDNGQKIVNALAERAKKFRVYSHWGILGGGFAENVPHETRERLQVSVLQTCALRREREGSSALAAVMARAAPEAVSLSELRAPTGFVHGYDLTRLLIAAVEQAAQTPAWRGGAVERRAAVRDALERLQAPVTGVLKVYERPFRAYSVQTPDAHEALGSEDLCMAKFDQNGFLEDDG